METIIRERGYVSISVMRKRHQRESQIALIREIWKLEPTTILQVRFWVNFHPEEGLWQACPSQHCQTVSVKFVDDICTGRQDGKQFTVVLGLSSSDEAPVAPSPFYRRALLSHVRSTIVQSVVSWPLFAMRSVRESFSRILLSST